MRFFEVVGERRGYTECKLFFGQRVGHIEDDGTIAFKPEPVGEQGFECLDQRGLAVEVDAILRGRLGLPGDADGAAAFALCGDVGGLTPLQGFFQFANAGGGCCSVENKFSQG